MKLSLVSLISFARSLSCEERCHSNRHPNCLAKCTKLKESGSEYAILQEARRVLSINFEKDTMEPIRDFNINGHEVDFATSVEHQGEFYVIGGLAMDAISKVGNCELKTLLQLPDSLVMAKAASWNGEIWMCGDKDKPEQCFTTNLSYFRPQKSSNEGHLTGGLVVTSDTNLLLRIAGYTRSTEVFDIENQVWHSNLIGKMTDNIRGFSTITTNDSIYLLGGFSDIQRDYTKNIWKWVSGQPTFQVVGQLLQIRMNSASVVENGKIYTIGGLDNLKAELFDIDADVSSSLNSMTSPQIFSQLIPRAFLQC